MKKITGATRLYRLDNAAQIYTASAEKDWNAVFRVGAQLTDNINPEFLCQAVKDLAPRFPTYYAQVHTGAFWDYLKPVTNYNIVSYETDYPCRPFQIGGNDKPLFRVLFKKNKISCEFFHSLTDGTGAITYLKTLLGRYLELQGVTVEKTDGVLDIHDCPSRAEIEDSFQRVYSKKRKASRKEADAYQYQPKARKNYLKMTNGNVSVSALKILTKQKYRCTITEYLVALYCYAFLSQYKKDKNNRTVKNPIRISVPANLRTIFQSNTLRNFAMFANVDIDPYKKNYTFEDVLEEIKEKMRVGLEGEKLLNMASQNVSEEKMLIARFAPNFLKKPVMKRCFNQFGERKYTAPLTNLGLQKLPDGMMPYVKHLEFMVGETVVNRIGCGVIATGDEMTITFTSISEDDAIQNFFFGFMEMEGVCVTAECNV